MNEYNAEVWYMYHQISPVLLLTYDGKLADKLELTLCLKVLITQKLKLSEEVREMYKVY